MTAPSGAGQLPRWAYVPGEPDKPSADYETLAQITALAALIKAKLERPQLAKADWVPFAVAIRT